MFGIFFHKIVIEKQVEQLGTLELQFGYKTKSSTVMCSTALTETIEYYVSKKTPVYVLLIDGSKDFDRVSHIRYFEHACVSSRGAQSTELVSLYIGYWTLNNYYYYY